MSTLNVAGPVLRDRERERSIAIFSGGTAANSLISVFNNIGSRPGRKVTYIIPISDNGGSSSEILRVFGGPGIGDIRSRLVRLIPPSHEHIYNLMNYRLPTDPDNAAHDWNTIVSGTSPLWAAIPAGERELLRSFLLHVNLEILKRARPPHSTFTFSNASVGNLFLTGARLFTGSFDSAIHLLSLLGGVSPRSVVMPIIVSNFSHHIAVGLENGEVITGQNAISHPSAPTAIPDQLYDAAAKLDSGPVIINGELPEDANLPGSLPALRQSSILFSKDDEEELPSRIHRLWYVNPFGQEISPTANPKALSMLADAETVIYSIGSLYTSIIPSLVCGGIGKAISTGRKPKYKILLLNGTLDRESGPKSNPLDAVAFVMAIAKAAEQSQGRLADSLDFDVRQYVTHIIHVDSPEGPLVDKVILNNIGVEVVRCWSAKHEGRSTSSRFDLQGLESAIESIIGRGDGTRSRRNTLQGGSIPFLNIG